MKYFFDQILIRLECGVDYYLYLPCVGTKHINANVNEYLKRLFKTMLSLCETTDTSISAFCSSKIHRLGPFKLIKTMLKSVHFI